MQELAERYGPRIFQLALRHMKNREDAEEVTQDVLMKVYRKIGEFRGDSALSSWIYRITFNTAMSRLRNARAGARGRAGARPRRCGARDGGRRRRAHAPSRRTGRTCRTRSCCGCSCVRRWPTALAELPEIYRAPVVLRDIAGADDRRSQHAAAR